MYHLETLIFTIMTTTSNKNIRTKKVNIKLPVVKPVKIFKTELDLVVHYKVGRYQTLSSFIHLHIVVELEFLHFVHHSPSLQHSLVEIWLPRGIGNSSLQNISQGLNDPHYHLRSRTFGRQLVPNNIKQASLHQLILLIVRGAPSSVTNRPSRLRTHLRILMIATLHQSL